jgi:hypothetical protein
MRRPARRLETSRGSGAPRGAGSKSATIEPGRGAKGLSHPPHAPWRSAHRRFTFPGRASRDDSRRPFGPTAPRLQRCSSHRGHSTPRAVPETSRERAANPPAGAAPIPTKRHASGWPPLGDEVNGIMRQRWKAGISFPRGTATPLAFSRMGEGGAERRMRVCGRSKGARLRRSHGDQRHTLIPALLPSGRRVPRAHTTTRLAPKRSSGTASRSCASSMKRSSTIWTR